MTCSEIVSANHRRIYVGHERCNALPPSKPWRAIVERLPDVADSPLGAAELAAGTLSRVRERFDRIHEDRGVQAAFAALISLATRGELHGPGLTSTAPRPDAYHTTIQVVKAVKTWIRANAESLEYAALAQEAATDAIARWTNEQESQPSLFSTDQEISETWSAASTGMGFCRVARHFFASFTERYLKYFLDREASAEANSLSQRESISSRLADHIDEISDHAFELSRITQSFAAGWFNKNARDRPPSDKQIMGFLAIAFGKMREELLREAES